MPSPLLTGFDTYGAVNPQLEPWPASRTIAAPSFPADHCIVWIAFDTFDTINSLPSWSVPSGWTPIASPVNVQRIGTRWHRVGIFAYLCDAAAVAGVIAPVAGSDPFVPAWPAESFWRVFVTGWTEIQSIGMTRERRSTSEQGTAPGFPWPVPYITGAGDGTFAQMSVGSISLGGGPEQESPVYGGLNGHTLAWPVTVGFNQYPHAALAYKQFSGPSVDSQPAVFLRSSAGSRIAQTFSITLNGPTVTPTPSRGSVSLGLHS